jgi:hypothetical protein
MTFDKVGDVAQSARDEMDHQIKMLSRAMKPYAKKLNKLSGDLRPYGERFLDMVGKHPGKSLAGAVFFGWLLSRFGRR